MGLKDNKLKVSIRIDYEAEPNEEQARAFFSSLVRQHIQVYVALLGQICRV